MKTTSTHTNFILPTYAFKLLQGRLTIYASTIMPYSPEETTEFYNIPESATLLLLGLGAVILRKRQ